MRGVHPRRRRADVVTRRTPDGPPQRMARVGVGTAMGLAAGTAVGVATGDSSVWPAAGAAAGAVIAVILNRTRYR